MSCLGARKPKKKKKKTKKNTIVRFPVVGSSSFQPHFPACIMETQLLTVEQALVDAFYAHFASPRVSCALRLLLLGEGEQGASKYITHHAKTFPQEAFLFVDGHDSGIIDAEKLYVACAHLGFNLTREFASWIGARERGGGGAGRSPTIK